MEIETSGFGSDDGGGMDPEAIRKCMSLGYSSKKSNTTIGQCNSWNLVSPSIDIFLNLCLISSKFWKSIYEILLWFQMAMVLRQVP